MGKRKDRPKSWQETVAHLKKDDWRRAFIGFEWSCEWSSYWLGKWAFLEVLEYLGKLSVLVALIFWIVEIPQRKQAAENSKRSTHYVAWQTINSAVGRSGNAGRLDALQDLNRDGISLDGVSLTGEAVIIGTSNSPLMLTNASLRQADFSDGFYQLIDFSRATIDVANWNGARCKNCFFRDTSLLDTAFANVEFANCDFRGALLGGNISSFTNAGFFNSDFSAEPNNELAKTNYPRGFQKARFLGESDRPNVFVGCSFVGTSFSHSQWDAVQFDSCNFAFADLGDVRVDADSSAMPNCNLYGATNATEPFVIWAYRQHTVITNITSPSLWTNWVYHASDTQKANRAGPEFFDWASNQWAHFRDPNDSLEWDSWRNQHLPP